MSGTDAVKKTDIMALALLCAVFLALVFFRLTDTPPDWDEIEIANWALLKLRGQDIFPNPFFLVREANLPGMTCFYTGTLNVYIILPFLKLLGPTITAIRIGFIALALLGLVSFYFCMRAAFGRLPAFAAALSLSTNTVFIFAARKGAEFEELLIISLLCAGAALLGRGLRTGRVLPLAAAGLLCGLALWAKLIVLAIFAGLAAAWLPARGPKARGIGVKGALFFCAGLFLGAFPLINAALSDGEILGRLGGSLFLTAFRPQETETGLSLMERALARLSHMALLLEEADMHPLATGRKALAPLLPFAALAIAGYCCVDKNAFEKDCRKPLQWAGAVCAALFCGLLFVPQTFHPTHVLLFLPAVAFVNGTAFYLALSARRARVRKTLLILLAACALQTVTVQARIFRQNLERWRPLRQYMVSPQNPALRALEYANAQGLTPVFIMETVKGNVLAAAWLNALTAPASAPAAAAPGSFYVITASANDLAPDGAGMKKETVAAFSDKSPWAGNCVLLKMTATDGAAAKRFIDDAGPRLSPLAPIHSGADGRES